MEELSTGDWSLIAKYLSEEANQEELLCLDSLAQRTPKLREEMEVLRHRMNTPAKPSPDVFRADPAFDKLHKRLKVAGLI